MKIISGKLKGRSISIRKKDDFRPTLSRIREDLFNLIDHNKILNLNLQNLVFFDLFCGSGSIGLEALSRGAKKVIFNDTNNLCLKLIKNFLIENNIKNYEIFNDNAYFLDIKNFENTNIVYIDPPYQNDLRLLEKIIIDLISKNILIILETDQRFSHESLILKKEYKNKNLFFLKKLSQFK